jgi:hypothetical protein
LVGMPDPGARPLREMVRQAWFNAYNNVTTRLFWPVRTLSQWFGQRGAARNGEDIGPAEGPREPPSPD